MTANTSNTPSIVANAESSMTAENEDSIHPISLSDDESQLYHDTQSPPNRPELTRMGVAAAEQLYSDFEAYLKNSGEKFSEELLKVFYLDDFALRSGFSLFSYGIQGERDSIVTECMSPATVQCVAECQTLSKNFKLPASPAGRGKPWSQPTWNTVCKVSTILKSKKSAGLDVVLLSRRNIPSLQVLTYWQFFADYSALGEDDRSKLCPKLWICVLRFLNFNLQESLTSCFDQDHWIPLRLEVQLPSECRNTRSIEKLNLAWPSSTPSSGALNLYIWQSYRQQAVFEGVAISWVHDSSSNVRQTLLLFDSTEDMQHFSNLISKHHLRLIQCCQTSEKTMISTIVFEHMLLILLRFIIIKQKLFLEAVAVNLVDLETSARNRPRRSKALYLFSLQDYLERQQVEIGKCLEVVKNYELNKVSGLFYDESISTVGDMEYLKTKSASTNDEVTSMIKRLATLRDFKQAEQNAITGFLIGLYVPLAFVTSFFGMNVSENTTANWRLSNFWTVAIPLTALTMVVPLIVGPTIRRSATLSIKSAKILTAHWPILIHIAGLIAWTVAAVRLIVTHLSVPLLDTITLQSIGVFLAILEALSSNGKPFLNQDYWLGGLVLTIPCFILNLTIRADQSQRVIVFTLVLPWIYFGIPILFFALLWCIRVVKYFVVRLQKVFIKNS